MQRTEGDVLQYIYEQGMTSQRAIAESLGYSLGTVNKAIRSLQDGYYISADGQLCCEVKDELKSYQPKRAIILAAGVGMRMVPINTSVPKGLLEVKGEPLVERIIDQLHEVGVREIYIVVGFLKEQYEYLIDEYNVRLIVNTSYDVKNNYYSLLKAEKYLENTYIIPCDIWCENNPFHRIEPYAWYMLREEESYKSDCTMNRKGNIVRTKEDQVGQYMVGIAYLDKENGMYVREQLNKMNTLEKCMDAFWEDALWNGKKMTVYARLDHANLIHEINTYEQLRQLDADSSQLESDIIDLIAKQFQVGTSDIKNITVLKKGMTNRSFLFQCEDKKYIMRIPGEGTSEMINRYEEYCVYQELKGKNICDNVVYINPDNGYKITEFLENAHNCNPENMDEVRCCMQYLRNFHKQQLQVPHSFDLFGQIEYYESLWNGKPSVYRDYENTKRNVFELKHYIDSCDKTYCLTHIDAVPDNFLFTQKGIKLIDWEYAGMQDPHVDIAMFAIYSMYNEEQVEELIDAYFTEGCKKEVRAKIYCYIATAGLLWSNWCEYKRHLGIEFGDYCLCQYRYAKDYYRKFMCQVKEWELEYE